ncbi:MAG: PASTA domain-containing protein [Bacteroidota bacterium]|nr:PASTA domain-containing protein [Bacteroidota bacterium]
MLKKFLIFTGSLIILFFVVNNVIMPLYVKHSDTAKVPRVTGMNYLDAKRIIEDGGLEIIQGEMKYDENIPIGQILDQNPPGDEIVKYGRRIYVTICGGEQLTDVPNLRGRSLRDAKFALEQRGLKIGETVKKNTNEFPENYVISQIIQPGSKVKKNSTLDLILSDGPVIGELKVPNVTGKNLEEAKKVITDTKLKLGKITYQTNNELPPGQIIDQYPKVDKSANENTTVDLFVARKKVIIKQENDEDSGEQLNTQDNKDETDTKENTPIQIEKPKDDSKAQPPDKITDKKTDKSANPPVKKDENKINKKDAKKEGDKNDVPK